MFPRVLFFSLEMLELITNESNKYAELNCKRFTWAKHVFSNKISMEEMRKYLGIRLAIGMIRCVEYKDIYATSFPYNFQHFEVIGKSRFEDINSSLHCESDTSSNQMQSMPNDDQHNLEQVDKVGTLLKMFQNCCFTCVKYRLSRELTLDEMMIRFQGRTARVYHIIDNLNQRLLV